MIWLFTILLLPYFIILLKIYSHLRGTQQFNHKEVPSVKTSVIIACRNEEKDLPFLLEDLGKQDYNHALFEVIIVDDNSTDNTFSIAFDCKKIQNIKVLTNPGKGKKSAIRTGVNEANGELIITTDADCRFGKNWISTMASFYSGSFPDLIIGPVQLKSRNGFFGRFQQLEFLSLQGITIGTALANNPVMCNGANLAFKKEVYLKHSKNLHDDIASGDDIFLLHSLKKEQGSKIVCLNSPNVIVTTSQPESLGSFLNQRTRWMSKVKAYVDPFTQLVSIVTFVTIFSTLVFLITGIFDKRFLLLFLVSFIIKSIPDFLILYETTWRFNQRHLLKWFLPSQIIYPFYVIVVICYSLFRDNRWK
jgi:biofilm PGA synthesis N-glycosyltransferase PgaC